MVFSIVDMGSNSFKLTVFDTKINKEIYTQRDVLRLGSDSFLTGKISLCKMKKACNILKQYREKSKEYLSDSFEVYATSAVRDAVNKEEFIDYIYKETDCFVKVLSGDQEAELIFKAIINDIQNPKSLMSIPQSFASQNPLSKLSLRGTDFSGTLGQPTNENVMVFDIGGGSSEIIIGDKEDIYYKKSFSLGAVRLYDMFFKNTNDKTAYENAKKYVNDLFYQDFSVFKDYKVKTLIGSSGTWTNLNHFMINKYGNIDFFSPKEIIDSIDVLLNMTLEERKCVIDPDRADIICAGVSEIEVLLRNILFSEIKVTNASLKEGLILNKIREV